MPEWQKAVDWVHKLPSESQRTTSVINSGSRRSSTRWDILFLIKAVDSRPFSAGQEVFHDSPFFQKGHLQVIFLWIPIIVLQRSGVACFHWRISSPTCDGLWKMGWWCLLSIKESVRPLKRSRWTNRFGTKPQSAIAASSGHAFPGGIVSGYWYTGWNCYGCNTCSFCNIPDIAIGFYLIENSTRVG